MLAVEVESGILTHVGRRCETVGGMNGAPQCDEGSGTRRRRSAFSLTWILRLEKY